MRVTKHEAGSFSWIELMTTDRAGARDFYTRVFGWSVQEDEFAPGQVYTMFLLHGAPVAALFEKGEQMAEVPNHWGVYVTVDDVDAATERARRLGGKPMAEPFDVLDAGRMAAIQDPTGAFFNLWQARGHIGAHYLGEPGALGWVELATRDPARAKSFYTELFGWHAETTSHPDFEYTTFGRRQGGEPLAGMMEMDEKWEGIPPHWMPYIAVEDVDATAGRADAAGGKVLVAPTDIPGVGRFALLRDPQGAHLSIIRFSH